MNWDVRSIEDSLLFIPLVPLAGALVLRLFGRQLGKGNVSLIACSTVFTSFVLSALIMVPMAAPWVVGQTTGPLSVSHDFGNWFAAGGLSVRYSLYVDHLTAIMLVVVTGISFVIHVYSTEYMAEEPDYHRFFAYLNLFVGFMLILVLANNLVLLFVGWEGVGLCSYLLIGFWFEDDQKASAGRKAFVVNRIGDFGFLLGVFTLFALFGTTEINHVSSARDLVGLAGGLSDVALGKPVPSGVLAMLGLTYGQAITAACLLLFVGATGKSAQVPLYVWLPDAMAGPTPVSALIHAATMVTAGVYVIARMSPFFAMAPDAMFVVASVGAFTALFAALMGFAQNDIKKVLAYSTVSQLGFMVMAVGIGAYWQAIFHLVTHAFFKALLFLGSGSVILGCHHEQDLRKMGGLRKRMPTTAWTFLVGTIAITGVFPLSGFFSKDELLHFLEETKLAGYPEIGHVAFAMGTLAALGTAFYMFRLYYLAFSGEPRSEAAEQAHESKAPIKFALVTLALGSIFGAAWGLPLIALKSGFQIVFDNFTQPVFLAARERLKAEPESFPGTTLGEAFGDFLHVYWAGFLVALGVAWLGLAIAYWLYRKGGMDTVGKVLKPGNFVYDLFLNKFYVDELYGYVIVWPFNQVANLLFAVIDTLIIEGLFLRGTTYLTESTGRLLRVFQNGDAQRYAAVIAVAAVAIVWALT